MRISPKSWLQPGLLDPGDRAFAELLAQSSMVDWIYGSVVCLALVIMTMNLSQPQLYAAPGAGVAVCAAVIATGLLLPRVAFGRSSTAMVAFVLSIYGLIVLVAHINGLGIRTPALNIGPVLLFVCACVAPQRVAIGMGLTAFALVLSLVPVSAESAAPHVPSLGAVVLSAVFALTLGGVLGVGVGRVLRQAIIASAQAAQAHFREVYSQQSLRSLRAVMDASPYAIVMSDLSDGRIRLFNAAFSRIIGRPGSEIEGATSISLGVWADLGQRSRLLERVRVGQALEELLQVRRPDGSIRTVRASATAVEIDGSQHLLLIGQDVSEERRRQIELQAVMDTAEAAIAVVKGGCIAVASRHYVELMRLHPGTTTGMSADFSVGGPDVAQALYRQYAPALRAGHTISFEHTAHRSDGSTFEARFTGRLLYPGASDGFTTVFLVEDITAANAHRQQLEKSREDALAASRAKTEFLAMMSHEIRTPLNGMLGLTELATDRRLDEEARQDYLRMILESGRSLTQILSDILDISKIEAGRLDLQPEVFELGRWLDGVRDSHKWSAESKGLRLLVQAPVSALGWVRADPSRLRQIVVNYLSNALKFTFQGEITVVVERPQAHRLRIEVRDTGMGISAEVQQRLFRPFEQADAGARQWGGTGLGLAICRELAQRMNGQAGVHSVLGSGSTFWVDVEVQPLQAPAAVDSPAESARPEGVLPLSGLRILLADDNRINQVVGARMLERAGAVVESVLQGQEAVQAVQQAWAEGRGFDVVLMDVEMPVMDGIEATRRIRELPAGQTLLIIAATAAALQDDLDAALAQGMDAAITKPYNSERLLSTILPRLPRSQQSGAELAH